MEKAKRTISKLFVVIALVLTIALCCALFGCGEKIKDGASDQEPPINAEDTPPNSEPTEDNGTGADNVFGEPIQNSNIYGMSYTGLCIRANINEKGEYYADDVTVELVYGVDIEKLNLFAKREINLVKASESVYICVNAYNLMNPSFYSNDTYTVLGNAFQSMEKGEVEDGILLIDKIPCNSINEIEGNEEADSEYGYLCADSLYGTEYEGSVENDPYRVTCYKKCSITLPRELFSTDYGIISLEMGVFVNREDQFKVAFVHNLAAPSSVIGFDYQIIDDKITLSNVALGGQFVFDGTASLR